MECTVHVLFLSIAHSIIIIMTANLSMHPPHRFLRQSPVSHLLTKRVPMLSWTFRCRLTVKDLSPATLRVKVLSPATLTELLGKPSMQRSSFLRRMYQKTVRVSHITYRIASVFRGYKHSRFSQTFIPTNTNIARTHACMRQRLISHNIFRRKSLYRRNIPAIP